MVFMPIKFHIVLFKNHCWDKNWRFVTADKNWNIKYQEKSAMFVEFIWTAAFFIFHFSFLISHFFFLIFIFLLHSPVSCFHFSHFFLHSYYYLHSKTSVRFNYWRDSVLSNNYKYKSRLSCFSLNEIGHLFRNGCGISFSCVHSSLFYFHSHVSYFHSYIYFSFFQTPVSCFYSNPYF